MNLATSFVGWTDDLGFHVVAVDVGAAGRVRWALRSTEWRTWQEGAAVIAEAILGDSGAERSAAVVSELTTTLSTEKTEWSLAGKRVSRWLRHGGENYKLFFGTQNTGRHWVAQRADLPAMHDDIDFGLRTEMSVEPHAKPILLSETEKKWHRRSARVKDLGVDIYDIARDVRSAAERATHETGRAFITTVSVPSTERSIVEREPREVAGGQPKRKRTAFAQMTGKAAHAAAEVAAISGEIRESPKGWVALQRGGAPEWEAQLPKDPTHIAAILDGMEKRSRGLRNGNPRSTRQGVMEFDVVRQGVSYRVLYNEHHELGKFVVLGVVRKGRGDAQQTALENARDTWKSFLANREAHKVVDVDVAALAKGLRAQGKSALNL